MYIKNASVARKLLKKINDEQKYFKNKIDFLRTQTFNNVLVESDYLLQFNNFGVSQKLKLQQSQIEELEDVIIFLEKNKTELKEFINNLKDTKDNNFKNTVNSFVLLKNYNIKYSINEVNIENLLKEIK